MYNQNNNKNNNNRNNSKKNSELNDKSKLYTKLKKVDKIKHRMYVCISTYLSYDTNSNILNSF